MTVAMGLGGRRFFIKFSKRRSTHASLRSSCFSCVLALVFEFHGPYNAALHI